MLNINNAKDLENAIGFWKYYGFSPSIRLFSKNDVNNNREIKIGLFEAKDLRHIWRYFMNQDDNETPNLLEVYWKESQINNILRNGIFFYII